jgi:hypothetical protein
MPLRLFHCGSFRTVPILVLVAYILLSYFYQKSSSKLAPFYPSKPLMTTKTAQLGGTASHVTVGKIGVSPPFLVSSPLPIPVVDTPPVI